MSGFITTCPNCRITSETIVTKKINKDCLTISILFICAALVCLPCVVCFFPSIYNEQHKCSHCGYKIIKHV